MSNKNRSLIFFRWTKGLLIGCLLSGLLIVGCNGKDSNDEKDEPKDDYVTLCNQAHDDLLACTEKVISPASPNMSDPASQKALMEAIKCGDTYRKLIIKLINTLLTEEQKQSKADITEAFKDHVTTSLWMDTKTANLDLSECEAKTTSKEQLMCEGQKGTPFLKKEMCITP